MGCLPPTAKNPSESLILSQPSRLQLANPGEPIEEKSEEAKAPPVPPPKLMPSRKDANAALPIPSSYWDAALGCVLGAFIGDAAGGPLEFMGYQPPKVIKDALDMKGGGKLKLGPGQVTDDSEMAISLLSALHESKPLLNADIIAKFYRKWLDSPPFGRFSYCSLLDVGQTIQKALIRIKQDSPSANDVADYAAKANKDSLSNGCLMRITPLAVWGRELSNADLDKAVRVDTKITHPHETAQQACVCYCIAIKHLLANLGNRQGAMKALR